MERRWSNPESLRSAGNSRIIDRLDIDAVMFEQPVGNHFALFGVTHHHGNDVAGIFHCRNAEDGQLVTDLPDAALMALPLGA